MMMVEWYWLIAAFLSGVVVSGLTNQWPKSGR